MDIFNQVRVSKKNPNFGIAGETYWLEAEVYSVSNLIVRYTPTVGRLYVFERTDDDSKFFEYNGRVIGIPEITEVGLEFICMSGRHNSNEQRVVVTRTGIYSD